MQKKTLSPLSILWICNVILFLTYAIGGPSLSFLKSSVLEYNNITSDPFDGAISPIAYVPDWSKGENINKARRFESFSISDFIEIPEYNGDLLADTLQKTTSANILHYAYPVVYMGSYRGNYVEYDGSHLGVDIRAPLGTPIVAVANAVVVKVKNTETGDGKYVILRHDNVDTNGLKETYYSIYEHLEEIIATEGTKVKRGDLIGKVGMTGITTTPHLHFQIDKASAPFHGYWPYTFREAADLGLDFFGAVNVGLGKENAIKYTINPMDFIKNHRYLGSAPAENNLVISTQMIADTTTPTTDTIETVVPKTETIFVPEVTIEKPEVILPIETGAIATGATEIETPHVVPTFIPDSEHIFSDIPVDSPVYAATRYLSLANVVRGYADGGFHPNDDISRSETILLYDRLFTNGRGDGDINIPFLDILPSANELAQALTRATIGGVVAKSKYFRPNDSLTRAEAITLLVRSASLPLSSSKTSLFKDVKAKSSHLVYINTFAEYMGLRGGSFEPDTNITRGELAKILYLFNQKKQKESN